MFFIVKRGTILVPSGPPDDLNRRHLFIFLTDPIGANRETLLVPIATIRTRESHDPTCRLFKGDHPFIHNESYVSYQFARIELADKIEHGVKSGILLPREILDGAIFARVCKGIEESRFVAPRIQNFYETSRGKAGKE